MKIYGIGTDITNISRIKNLIKKKRFTVRVFNNFEILKCSNLSNKADCFAKRFAAKEAFSKALGLGVSKGINFKEIIINNNKLGKPSIKLSGKTKKIVNKIFNNKKFNIFLSLSDDKPFAIATVIISI